MSQDASRIGKLILVPAVITLAVTLLRLVGELQRWSPALFNRGEEQWSTSAPSTARSTAAALVGIVWLVPLFVAFVIVGLAIGILAWPALGRTLLAYGLAARISRSRC